MHRLCCFREAALTKSREPCGLLSPSTGSMRRSPDASSTTGRSKRRRLFGDPGAGKVTCCRRSTATVPRMRPPLLAGKPCSPNAAASCYLARRGGLVQLTELAWVRQLTEATRSQRHDRGMGCPRALAGPLTLKGLTQPVVAYNVPLVGSQAAFRIIEGGVPST